MTDKPAIVTRQEWGADESYRTGTPDYADTDDGCSSTTPTAATTTPAPRRASWSAACTTTTPARLHWSDVGYNFLIDRYGTVYEGRYGGMTKGVIGAQVLGFNTGSVGVSMIGTFSKATPHGGLGPGPRGTPGLEARRAPHRPAGQDHAHLWLRREVLHRRTGRRSRSSRVTATPTTRSAPATSSTRCCRRSARSSTLWASPRSTTSPSATALHQPRRRRCARQRHADLPPLRACRLEARGPRLVRRAGAQRERLRRPRWRRRGRGTTTTARSCRTVTTRSPSRRRTPRRRGPAGHRRGARGHHAAAVCRARPSTRARSAPTATVRTTRPASASSRARAAPRGSPCWTTRTRPCARCSRGAPSARPARPCRGTGA